MKKTIHSTFCFIVLLFVSVSSFAQFFGPRPGSHSFFPANLDFSVEDSLENAAKTFSWGSIQRMEEAFVIAGVFIRDGISLDEISKSNVQFIAHESGRCAVNVLWTAERATAFAPLARDRARAVREELIKSGLSSNQIRIMSQRPKQGISPESQATFVVLLLEKCHR